MRLRSPARLESLPRSRSRVSRLPTSSRLSSSVCPRIMFNCSSRSRTSPPRCLRLCSSAAGFPTSVSTSKRIMAPNPQQIVSRNERSEEHTSELQSHSDLVCRLLLEKKKKKNKNTLRNHKLHTKTQLDSGLR